MLRHAMKRNVRMFSTNENPWDKFESRLQKLENDKSKPISYVSEELRNKMFDEETADKKRRRFDEKWSPENREMNIKKVMYMTGVAVVTLTTAEITATSNTSKYWYYGFGAWIMFTLIP
jgi:hypothetical protein